MSLSQKDSQVETTRAWMLSKFTGLRNFHLETVKIPKLSPHDVLVEVKAVSLQFRDILIAKGMYGSRVTGPMIPGSDMAGLIVKRGEHVSDDWKFGDRICAHFFLEDVDGDHTEKRAASALGAQVDGVLVEYKVLSEHALVHIPDHLTFEEASTLPCAGLTAYNALFGTPGRPLMAGQTVLILGTGGVSIFALQLTVAAGARAIITSSSNSKLEVAKKLGAHHAINYREVPEWHEEVRRVTGGRGVDLVVEVGGQHTFQKSLASLRPAGVITIVGVVSLFTGEKVEPYDPLPLLVDKAVNLRGVHVGSKTEFEHLMRVIDMHTLHPVIDKCFSFEELNEAVAYLDAQRHIGKVVVRV